MSEAVRRTPEYSRVSMTQVIRQPQVNSHGTAHGGVIVYLADTVAGSVSARHCGGPTLTGTIESFVFRRPIAQGSIVTATGTVTDVGRTSLHVEVVVTAESMHRVEEPAVVAQGLFRMVHVDAAGRPVPAPALEQASV